jgi:hypothetical protein
MQDVTSEKIFDIDVHVVPVLRQTHRLEEVEQYRESLRKAEKTFPTFLFARLTTEAIRSSVGPSWIFSALCP